MGDINGFVVRFSFMGFNDLVEKTLEEKDPDGAQKVATVPHYQVQCGAICRVGTQEFRETVVVEPGQEMSAGVPMLMEALAKKLAAGD
jgi:hypothetical protein